MGNAHRIVRVTIRGCRRVERATSRGARVVIRHRASGSQVEFYRFDRGMFVNTFDLNGLDLLVRFVSKTEMIGYISRVVVPEASRRSGIGSRLMRLALRDMFRASIKRVFLVLDVSGDVSEVVLEKFYRKLGFTVICRHARASFFFRNPPETFMGARA